MSEQVNHQGHEGRPALRRKGRVLAMGKTLGVSLAQAAAAAVITFGCDTVVSVAARNSGPPSPGTGILFWLAVLLLAPLGAMIIGSLVAEKLQLAAPGAYSLSVIAVMLIAVLGVWNPSPTLFGNVPLLLLVLAAVNLLIGYSTGMHRSWSPPPGTSSSAS